jgi:hypothetical protein
LHLRGQTRPARQRKPAIFVSQKESPSHRIPERQRARRCLHVAFVTPETFDFSRWQGKICHPFKWAHQDHDENCSELE